MIFDPDIETDMVFIKTSSICNIGHAVDIGVQCIVNIHGHKLTLHAFLDSGSTNSTIDEDTLTSILPTHFIKSTNQSLVST